MKSLTDIQDESTRQEGEREGLQTRYKNQNSDTEKRKMMKSLSGALSYGDRTKRPNLGIVGKEEEFHVKGTGKIFLIKS